MTDAATPGWTGAPLVGDHLALDLLNTESRSDGGAVDGWHSGDAVLGWLKAAGVSAPSAGLIDRAGLLGPVAEAVAQLLAEGDFTLVKQCEHPDCVLWFYDRTKAHKRRWCSMAVCGNRYKAAQFRKKNSAQSA